MLVRLQISTWLQASFYKYMCVCVRVYMCLHMYVFIYIYTHIYIVCVNILYTFYIDTYIVLKNNMPIMLRLEEKDLQSLRLGNAVTTNLEIS